MCVDTSLEILSKHSTTSNQFRQNVLDGFERESIKPEVRFTKSTKVLCRGSWPQGTNRSLLLRPCYRQPGLSKKFFFNWAKSFFNKRLYWKSEPGSCDRAVQEEVENSKQEHRKNSHNWFLKKLLCNSGIEIKLQFLVDGPFIFSMNELEKVQIRRIVSKRFERFQCLMWSEVLSPIPLAVMFVI